MSDDPGKRLRGIIARAAEFQDVAEMGDAADALDALLAEKERGSTALLASVREANELAAEVERLREALREIADFNIGVRLAPVAACKEIAADALAAVPEERE